MARSHVAAAVAAAGRARQAATFPAKPLPFAVVPAFAFGFFAPEPPLSVNRTAGRSFRGSHLHKLAWESAASAAAREHAAGLAPFVGHRVRVTFALPVKRPGACDAGNYVGGVSVKAAQDGLTRTGLLIPDDTAVWLDTGVVFWRGGPEGDVVRVRVEVSPPVDDPGLW